MALLCVAALEQQTPPTNPDTQTPTSDEQHNQPAQQALIQRATDKRLDLDARLDAADALGQAVKLQAAGLPQDQRPAFVTADIRELRLETTFDAVLMMFAVLGYQHTNAEVLGALATARAHLEVGGLLAFDVWYGPAVLRERPGHRAHLGRVPPAASRP